MKSIKELDVYVLAEKLADRIWEDYDEWSLKARSTMGFQMIRAADSIAANLAEGYGRYTPADRKMFYRYARGSFEETKAWLRKAVRRKVIKEPEMIKVYKAVCDELGPKLNAFIRTTNKERAV